MGLLPFPQRSAAFSTTQTATGMTFGSRPQGGTLAPTEGVAHASLRARPDALQHGPAPRANDIPLDARGTVRCPGLSRSPHSPNLWSLRGKGGAPDLRATYHFAGRILLESVLGKGGGTGEAAVHLGVSGKLGTKHLGRQCGLRLVRFPVGTAVSIWSVDAG